jgi:microcystin-dependent protein
MLNLIQPAMTEGLLKTSNNLSEIQASLDTTYTNIGLDQGLPVGCIFPYAGATAPTGWLFCNGQAVSRTVESQLFAVLGTTYGAGNGTTTFNLPDLRGRVIIGKDTTTGSANRVTTAGSNIDSTVLGATGGAEELALDEAGGLGNNYVVDPINVQPSIVLNYIIRSRLSGLAP